MQDRRTPGKSDIPEVSHLHDAARQARRIAGWYAVIAGLWILTSDRLMALLTRDSDSLVLASMVKGWGFVAVTSLLLYLLIRRLVRQIAAAAQRERALQEERNRNLAMFESITGNTTDAIFVKDRQHRYIFCNQALADFLHRPVESILGHTDFDLVAEASARQFQADDARIAQHGETESYEEALVVDGQVHHYLTTKGALRIDGRTEGVFAIVRDNTERKLAEAALAESELKLRLFISHVPVALAMLDRDMRYCAASRRWLSDYGIADQDIVGKSHYELFPKLPQRWKAANLRALGGEVVRVDEDCFERADGQVQWLRWEVRPWCKVDGNVGGIVIFTEDLTAYRQARQELEKAESEWTGAMNRFDDAIYLLDLDNRLRRANRAFYELVGIEPDAAIGQPIETLLRGEDETVDCPVCRAVADGQDTVITVEADNPSNRSQRPLEVTVKRLRDETGAANATLVSQHDLTRSREIEQNIRLSASVFENTIEGVVITDPDGKVLQINHAFTQILGYTRDEVIGANPSMWQSGRHDEAFYRSMWQALKETGQWRGELWNRRKDGAVFPEWLTISEVRDHRNRLTHYVGIFSDISQIKHSQEQLDHLAHHDPLTDLPNRLLLQERLDQAILHARRREAQLAVIFLDLDRFKQINDSLGHPSGDRLLQVVANRLRQHIRAGDTLARIGGDEFVVVLEDMGRSEHAGTAAQKLMSSLVEPVALDGEQVTLTCSIGIALYPSDGEDSVTLLKNADAAMYRSKEQGRNNYQFYTRELTREALRRVSMENQLRRALENREFHLVYQPQVALDGGAVVGVETLLRWDNPELGAVSPAVFIPLAEETGLIHSIGRWVLIEACRQGCEWLNKGRDFGRIAVNIAGPQLQRGDLVQVVREVLTETGLPPQRLELEVTEGFIMQQADSAIETLNTLRQLGIALSIDDFGTGYSSLSYLKRLPLHKLKIDQSFVRDIPEDANDMAIADAVIGMGRSLGLGIIAEGVETGEQAAFLLEHGCHEAQGYFYSRPVAADQVEALFAPLAS